MFFCVCVCSCLFVCLSFGWMVHIIHSLLHSLIGLLASSFIYLFLFIIHLMFYWLILLSYFLINYVTWFLQMCEEERNGSDFRSSSMLSNLQKSNPEKFQRWNFFMSFFQLFSTSFCFRGKNIKMSIWNYHCLWFCFEKNSFGFSTLHNQCLSLLGATIHIHVN